LVSKRWLLLPPARGSPSQCPPARGRCCTRQFSFRRGYESTRLVPRNLPAARYPDRFRAIVPNKVSARGTPVQADGVAPLGIENRIDEAVRRASAATERPDVHRRFSSWYVAVHHGASAFQPNPKSSRMIVAKPVELRLSAGAY